ncbi:hypothetical protein C7U89_30240 [Bradyrhizobium sp. WBOS4]|nr:hypothetical protein [Bradyrhizobium sp. WBOS8]MDD1587184.1 hypothetical protein [Bradyrhizobium sp. WBOS4]UUO51309.1 hypothetical protein DCM78_17095 [Bradyrhizobium sp. WBOS04]UUO63664.1 hypothetical protein DCM80_24840 [Bradyrhizobium sp. WBOS08]
MGLDRRHAIGALPLPQAGEGWGEGVSAKGQSPRGESPLPRLRRNLSRKRERSNPRSERFKQRPFA